MSQRFKPNADDSDDEEDDNGEDNNNGVFEKREKENYKRKKKGRFCSYKRAKKVVLSPFSKFHNVYKRYKRSTSSHEIPNLSSSSISSTRSGVNYSCCLCISMPQTLDSDYEDTDPNHSNVCYGYYKSLIENNDFYSKECNTHFGD